MSYRFKTEHGVIEMRADGMPSQCGMTIIHNVLFKQVRDKEKLYDYFLNTIILGDEDIRSDDEGGSWGYSDIDRDNGRWNVNKYILSDYLRPASFKSAHLHDFCKWAEALEGPVVYNTNSGHNVQSFEFNKKISKNQERV